MLFRFYFLALAAGLAVAGLFLLAGQSAGLNRDYGPLPVGRGVSVPPHTEPAGSPPWWALIFTLVADGTLFTSLLFGTLYLWISAPNWPPAQTFTPNLGLAVAAVVALVVAATAARGSLRSIGAGGMARDWIGLAALGLVAAIAVVVGLIGGIVPHPTEHALGATAAALLAYVAFHAGIGLLFPAQQSAAPRERLCVVPAVDGSPPDAALARLHGRDRRDRARPRVGTAALVRSLGT